MLYILFVPGPHRTCCIYCIYCIIYCIDLVCKESKMFWTIVVVDNILKYWIHTENQMIHFGIRTGLCANHRCNMGVMCGSVSLSRTNWSCRLNNVCDGTMRPWWNTHSKTTDCMFIRLQSLPISLVHGRETRARFANQVSDCFWQPLAHPTHEKKTNQWTNFRLTPDPVAYCHRVRAHFKNVHPNYDEQQKKYSAQQVSSTE